MSESKKILLIGTGGHCLSVLDSLLATCKYETIGIVGKEECQFEGEQRRIMGVPIIGSDADLFELFSQGYTEAFVAIGSVGDISLRKKLYQIVKKIGFQLPNIIDNTSVVSKNITLGEGIYIGKNAVVNACTIIGDCVILNTGCTVEHECKIGDFVHIAPGAILSGNVEVHEGTHIGAGSIVRQGIHIGYNTMVGIGSVVVKDIPSYVTAYGNPCKEVK